MDFLSYQRRLEYILELIKKNRFRSLSAVAKRFGISTRTLKRMLNNLREQGHQVRYDKKQKKYYIKKDE